LAEFRQCEFFLVRYVPDPVKGEFVNIGVLLREAVAPAANTVVRFTRDWARVRCVDPDADVALLEGLESEIRRRLAAEAAGSGARASDKPVTQSSDSDESYSDAVAPDILKEMEDSFSTTIQLTPAKACLAESMVAEVEQLMRLHVESRKRPRVARNTGRQAIHSQMRTHFERAGVWDLMRKRIAAASYTRPGDPLRIDCGYRPNGVVRMFHAVSLEGDLETAKVLAFSVAGMREGVTRVEGAELELTAIVEPLMEVRGGQEEGDRTAQYRFAVETMEQQAIRVLTTSDLPRIAAAARVDLHI
jgi:hypothetical protein